MHTPAVSAIKYKLSSCTHDVSASSGSIKFVSDRRFST